MHDQYEAAYNLHKLITGMMPTTLLKFLDAMPCGVYEALDIAEGLMTEEIAETEAPGFPHLNHILGEK